MANITKHVVTITTDASGDGTGYTDILANGFVEAIRYVKSDYDNGVDMTITCEGSGQAIVTLTNQNASATTYPRAATNDVTGAASLFAAGGAAVNDKIPVAGERIKIVVAQGGNAKSGTFHLYVGG